MAESKRVIFLDVDGVLNRISDHKNCMFPLNDECLKNLKSIIDRTGCKIVLSSAWRNWIEAEKVLKRAFLKLNIPLWISKTPEIPMRLRKEEISTWIIENGFNGNLCIIDDLIEADVFCGKFFVRTHDRDGLTSEDAERVIQILEN
jgi:hypothetical protein